MEQIIRVKHSSLSAITPKRILLSFALVAIAAALIYWQTSQSHHTLLRSITKGPRLGDKAIIGLYALCVGSAAGVALKAVKELFKEPNAKKAESSEGFGESILSTIASVDTSIKSCFEVLDEGGVFGFIQLTAMNILGRIGQAMEFVAER